MPRRITLTNRQRDALLLLPTSQANLLKHYTLSDEDLGHIRQRRRPQNMMVSPLPNGNAFNNWNVRTGSYARLMRIIVHFHISAMRNVRARFRRFPFFVFAEFFPARSGRILRAALLHWFLIYFTVGVHLRICRQGRLHAQRQRNNASHRSDSHPVHLSLLVVDEVFCPIVRAARLPVATAPQGTSDSRCRLYLTYTLDRFNCNGPGYIESLMRSSKSMIGQFSAGVQLRFGMAHFFGCIHDIHGRLPFGLNPPSGNVCAC